MIVVKILLLLLHLQTARVLTSRGTGQHVLHFLLLRHHILLLMLLLLLLMLLLLMLLTVLIMLLSQQRMHRTQIAGRGLRHTGIVVTESHGSGIELFMGSHILGRVTHSRVAVRNMSSR